MPPNKRMQLTSLSAAPGKRERRLVRHRKAGRTGSEPIRGVRPTVTNPGSETMAPRLSVTSTRRCSTSTGGPRPRRATARRDSWGWSRSMVAWRPLAFSSTRQPCPTDTRPFGAWPARPDRGGRHTPTEVAELSRDLRGSSRFSSRSTGVSGVDPVWHTLLPSPESAHLLTRKEVPG